MPYLGDLLGLFLSEFTIGRAKGDVESLNISELYKADPILKSLSSARFRLPEIKIEIPIALSDFDDDNPDINYKRIELDKVKPLYSKILNQTLLENSVKLNSEKRERLKKEIMKYLDYLQNEPEALYSADYITNNLTAFTEDVLIRLKIIPEGFERRKNIREKLLERTFKSVVSIKQPPNRLKVIANTKEVKEQGPSILKLQLSFLEEGLEWTRITNDDGSSEDKIVPE